jgi:glutamate dehydrogenase
VRVNTDAIDNSAGVDTSDHEVNIKILLDGVMRSGDMTEKQRIELLASMTDEVADLVLADNYSQNLALSNSQAVAGSLMHVHESWIRRLERKGMLHREIEFLPTVKEFQARRSAGSPLTAPELAVLLAYTKIVLAKELLESDLPDDPFLHGELFSYFPSQLRQGQRDAMGRHPLRREIIVTQVVNNLVNFAGITFFHRLSQETSASAEELARAHFVCREVYGANDLIVQIDALDNQIAAAVQTDMRLSVRTLIERASRWLVNNRRPPLDSEATVAHFGTDIQTVMQALPEILTGVQAEEFESRHKTLETSGVPPDLARAVAVLPPAYAVLEVVEIAKRDGIDPLEVARVHSVLAERLGLSELTGMIYGLPRDDRWQTMARASLRDDLHAVHATLTAHVLAATDPDASAEDRVSAWETDDAVVVSRAKSTLDEITSDSDPDLARLSVGLRVVRTMLAN